MSEANKPVDVPATDEVQELFDKLRVRKAAIDAQLEPIRAKRDAIVAKMTPLEEQARALQNEIKAIIEGENLAKLDKQISTLARALGAKSMKAEPKKSDKS